MPRFPRPFRISLAAAAVLAALCLCAAPAWAQADPTDRIAARAAAAAPAATPSAPVSPDALPLGRPGPALLGEGGSGEAGGGMGGGYLLSTAGALGLVIGLVLVARWVVVKLGGAPAVASSSAVELLSRTAVAPKSHVLLLRVGRRVLVVGDGSGGLQPLGEIDDADEVADLLGAVTAARPGSVTQNFGGLLERFNRNHDEAGRRRDEGADGSEQHSGAALDALSGLKSRINHMGKA